jgi:Putative peptidoglycan binding domain
VPTWLPIRLKPVLEPLRTPDSDSEDLAVERVFTDLDEVPEELLGAPEDELEGDDSLLAATGGEGLIEVEPEEPRELRAPRRRRYRIVPFIRPLKLGKRGKDVIALQRALRAKGIRRGRPTGLFGRGTRRDVKKLQRQAQIDQTGVYGPKTHARLARWYDDYGVWLLHQSRVGSRKQQAQRKLRGSAIFLINRAPQISYTQGPRRMEGVNRNMRTPGQFPHYMDCSSGVTYLYFDADLPDPNGLGYNGLGYTGTLAVHGERAAGREIGDLHFYGGGHPWSHVSMELGNGFAFSMGSDSGPHLLRSNYRPVRLTKRYDLTKRR